MTTHTHHSIIKTNSRDHRIALVESRIDRSLHKRDRRRLRRITRANHRIAELKERHAVMGWLGEHDTRSLSESEDLVRALAK